MSAHDDRRRSSHVRAAEPLLGTTPRLAAVNLAAVVAAPLVAVLAVRTGQLGVMGWVLPAASFSIVLAASLVAFRRRLSGRPTWLPGLLLAVALVLTAYAAVAEAVAR